MRTITIDPITRVEGHGKITLHLNDAGTVEDSQFHVTQIRGFEKFCEGRPFYEMPSLMARICGICPVSHLLASSKACDSIMAVRIPTAARKLREMVHMGQTIQSHALSFYHLSAPDLLLGMDADPAKRNVVGLVEKHPEIARQGILLRKFGQRVIEGLAAERVHPSWIVPGGVSNPLDPDLRDRLLAELPDVKDSALRTLDLLKSVLDNFKDEIAAFGNFPSLHMGTVDEDGFLDLYDGGLRFKDAEGEIVADHIRAEDYVDYIGEAVVPWSYLKMPYFKPMGYPDGLYRVGPLGRMNVIDRTGCPASDHELEAFRDRFGPIVSSSFHFHYARLIELLYAVEKLGCLLKDPDVLGKKVRANAEPNWPRRRRHHRGAARHPGPSLQGRRRRPDDLGQPDRRHRQQQPRHEPQRAAGRRKVRQGSQTQGRHAQPDRGPSSAPTIRASVVPPTRWARCRWKSSCSGPTDRSSIVNAGIVFFKVRKRQETKQGPRHRAGPQFYSSPGIAS